MGSNSGAVYWMDIFHLVVLKKCINVCLKRPKINEKEAGVGSFFKNKISLGTTLCTALHTGSAHSMARAIILCYIILHVLFLH